MVWRMMLLIPRLLCRLIVLGKELSRVIEPLKVSFRVICLWRHIRLGILAIRHILLAGCSAGSRSRWIRLWKKVTRVRVSRRKLRVRWTAAEDGVEDDAAHSEAAVEAHHTGERIEQGHRTADSKLQGHMPVEAHTDRHIGYQAHSLGLMQCRK
ncbi:hypothetical protein F2Q69_00053607 [Brassica cretica]|uniref:Uncharacterized protein n=1 Tax=Brassica cretica TaxID=69181 RepID=A0A8S9N074_BRACR|nr:hypothetical protein F2Q69_00053607 [Brassica cretica]